MEDKIIIFNITDDLVFLIPKSEELTYFQIPQSNSQINKIRRLKNGRK